MRPEGSLLNPESIAVTAPDTVEVLGVPLGLTDYEDTLDWIDATAAETRDRAVQQTQCHV